MVCWSQSDGGRGRTRQRVASRHPAAVHVDRRTEEENLFVLRRLAQGTSHRCRVLLAEELNSSLQLRPGFAAAVRASSTPHQLRYVNSTRRSDSLAAVRP